MGRHPAKSAETVSLGFLRPGGSIYDTPEVDSWAKVTMFNIFQKIIRNQFSEVRLAFFGLENLSVHVSGPFFEIYFSKVLKSESH